MEREININYIVAEIIRRWKGLLIAGIIGAVVMAGLGWMQMREAIQNTEYGTVCTLKIITANNYRAGGERTWNRDVGMYKRLIKRMLDLILSTVAGLILLIPMLVIAVVIKLDSKGPVLFKQTRIGRNKETFEIFKFRTMRTDTPKDCPTHMLEDPNAFITRTGKILRKTSLDELPQILNILRGQMSIIGPRPALWNQFDLIMERDKYGVNAIRPGLTGWAQINGRDELEIPVKAKLDGEYVEKQSFSFDCKCFFGTISSVLRHDGVVEGKTDRMMDEEQKE